jgi:hypothetical protein
MRKYSSGTQWVLGQQCKVCQVFCWCFFNQERTCQDNRVSFGTFRDTNIIENRLFRYQILKEMLGDFYAECFYFISMVPSTWSHDRTVNVWSFIFCSQNKNPLQIPTYSCVHICQYMPSGPEPNYLNCPVITSEFSRQKNARGGGGGGLLSPFMRS